MVSNKKASDISGVSGRVVAGDTSRNFMSTDTLLQNISLKFFYFFLRETDFVFNKHKMMMVVLIYMFLN